jgi:Na+/glutamate symporter
MADYGMSTVMNESLAQMRAMRPIDMALNMLTTNLILGCILGFPIAVVIKKSQNNN